MSSNSWNSSSHFATMGESAGGSQGAEAGGTERRIDIVSVTMALSSWTDLESATLRHLVKLHNKHVVLKLL